MYCDKCGSKLKKSDKFCKKCGAEVSNINKEDNKSSSNKDSNKNIQSANGAPKLN